MTTSADRGERVRSEVVSFVRRSTRMRSNQRRAWDRYHSEFVIEVPRLETSTSIHPSARLDLTEAFGRRAPLIVEIGPGTGESLIPMARARAGDNVLAFEVYQPAIARILGALGREEIDNVRLIEADAVAGLRHVLAADSVDELWTFFPDPWPKARHHKRRLQSPEFDDLAASRLKPDGRWRLATDWADYAGRMRDLLDDHPRLVNDHDQEWGPRWSDRPVSRFEARGIEAGRQIFDLSYSRAR
jgi:tRNA (guanine-N7-)-methyltransferase